MVLTKSYLQRRLYDVCFLWGAFADVETAVPKGAVDDGESDIVDCRFTIQRESYESVSGIHERAVTCVTFRQFAVGVKV